MTIGANIRKLREARNLTQEEFGKIADVSAMAVSQWENDRAVPRMGAVQRLADALKVPVSEIIDGEHATHSSLPDGAFSPAPSHVATAPLYGDVHAGVPTAEETSYDVIELPAEVAERHPEAFFLRVDGDCMDRVYPEGCYVLVDPALELVNGKIMCLEVEGIGNIMRRAFKTARTLLLAPDSFNPVHEDIVISLDDGACVKAIGRVVWFQAAKEL